MDDTKVMASLMLCPLLPEVVEDIIIFEQRTRNPGLVDASSEVDILDGMNCSQVQCHVFSSNLEEVRDGFEV